MAKNLYSVTRFNVVGSSVQHEEPYLITDSPVDLKVGESHIVSIEGDGVRITKGDRIKRLPDYKQNSVVFDSHAKEFVMVSNGECVLDHSSPESFKESHAGGECQYAPSEAIALRPIISEGKVLLAWTYRAVNPCHLEATPNADEIKAKFEAVLSKRRSARFIGRV